MANYTTPVTSLTTTKEVDFIPIADFKILDAAYNWTTQYNVYPVKGGNCDNSASLTHPATLPGDAVYIMLIRKVAGP